MDFGTAPTGAGSAAGPPSSDLTRPGSSGSAPSLPRLFGEYELLEEIARGGMGVVYRARQTRLKREVAVKMILYSQFAGEDYFQRFLAEAQSIAKLRHPNIIAVFDVGLHEGLPFFSMEYVPGPSLAELVREQPLAPLRAARYLETVARAIHHAHQEKILHRDLKPSNILVDLADQPRVTDFGLARRLDGDSDLTISGQPLGTPSYMPPEQVAVRRAELGPASDVYSLGAILYHLLTGRPPFLAESLANTFEQILHSEPVAPRLLIASIPRDLETVCLKCLEKEPGKRYGSADALADELGRVQCNVPIRARPASPLEKVRRWCQRRPALAVLLAGTFMTVLVAILLITREWRQAEAANAKVASNVRETELRLAEVQLNQGRSLEGLATLARLARQYPRDPVTVNRLFAELNYQTFVRPVGRTIHEGQIVWSADLSSDERRLVTTTDTREAFVWSGIGISGRAPELLYRLAHPDRVYLARFSPGGKRIATVCADRQIRMWDAATGLIVGEPLVHGDEIFAFCFSPLGAELASAQVDGSVRVWNLTAGRVRFTFPPGQGALSDFRARVEPIRIHDSASLAYSRDGTLLLSGVNTVAARIWDMQTGDLSVEFRHDAPIMYAEFNSDGSRALTASKDRSVRVWDTRTGALVVKEQWLPTVPIQAHFSPDGKKVATGFFNHTVSIWDTATGESPLAPLRHKNYVQDTAFSRDGQSLLVAVHDGTAHLWDVACGRPLAEPVRAATSLRSARFLTDGQRFMTRGTGGVRFWRLGNAPVVTRMSIGDRDQIYAARFQDKGREIVTINSKSVGNVWDSNSGKRVGRALEEPGKFFRELTSSIDPFSKPFAASALVWERRSGRKLAEFLKTNELLSCFAASADSQRLALGLLAGGGRVIDLARDQARAVELKYPSAFASIEFSRDGRRLVTSSLDSTARVWDANSGQPLSPPLLHKGPVMQASISATGRWVLTRGHFPGAYVWDLTQAPLVGRLLPHESEVYDARFDTKGQLIVTASADWTALLWNAAAARPLGYPLRHELDVRQALFTPDGSRVITACADGTVRLWDSATSMPLGVPLRTSDVLDTLDISPDGEAIVCGSLDGNAYRCEIGEAPVPAPAWLPDLADALAGTHQVSASLAHPLPPDALRELEKRLRALPQQDFYSRWVNREFLAPEQAHH